MLKNIKYSLYENNTTLCKNINLMLNVGDRSEWSEPIGLVLLLTVGHVCKFVYLFAYFRFPHVVVDNVK